MNPTNLSFELQPKTTLFEEEANVIVAIVKDIIEGSVISARSGTFLLYGIKNGEHEPERLISFDLSRRGPTKKFFWTDKNSRELAEEVIERVAGSDYAGEPYRGVITYYVDTPLFLELWSTCGRFACAFYADKGFYSDMTYVYCAVAKALAMMRKGDEVLQESCEEIFLREIDEYTGILVLREYVERLFNECKLPEIAIWKKWHEAAIANSEVFTPYFG